MAIVNFLAELWGFSLVIIGLSLLINPNHVRHLLEMMTNDVTLFVGGMARTVLGVAALLSYNVWDNSWRVAITLLGWILLISGLGLLFLPQMAVKMIEKLKNNEWTPVIFVVMIALGCFLLYMGFNG